MVICLIAHIHLFIHLNTIIKGRVICGLCCEANLLSEWQSKTSREYFIHAVHNLLKAGEAVNFQKVQLYYRWTYECIVMNVLVKFDNQRQIHKNGFSWSKTHCCAAWDKQIILVDSGVYFDILSHMQSDSNNKNYIKKMQWIQFIFDLPLSAGHPKRFQL